VRIGPDRSGKTTLLSSLADRDVNATVEGTILVDGTARSHNFKHLASFVPQEASARTRPLPRPCVEASGYLGLCEAWIV
jgi:ABC-type cobalamin/Fe3+-siderophores transport system ATPase subunit